jgi:hypothetical protein
MMINQTPTFSTLLRSTLAYSIFLAVTVLFTFNVAPAHASSDIQMLPPEQGVSPPEGTKACPQGLSRVLTWDGKTAIGCAPDVSIDGGNNLSVGGDISGKKGSFSSVTAPTGNFSSQVTVGGSIATNTTVNTANTVAEFLNSCSAAGGGIVSVDKAGKLVCGTTSPLGSIIYVKSVAFNGSGFYAQINNAVYQGTVYYSGSESHPDAVGWQKTCDMSGDGDSTQFNAIITNTACMKFVCEGINGPMGGDAGGWPRLAQYAGGCPLTPSDPVCSQSYGMNIDCFNSQ